MITKDDRRRKVDSDLVREISDVCQMAGAKRSDQVDALMDSMGIGSRQAYRYIAVARRYGWLR